MAMQPRDAKPAWQGGRQQNRAVIVDASRVPRLVHDRTRASRHPQVVTIGLAGEGVRP